MKLNKILGFAGITALLAFSACDPIEDREELANSFNPEAIDLEVVQATPGGNKLSIQMNTEGVTGYWDYIINTKYSDRVEVVFPFTGTHEFTYHVTTPYMTEDGAPESREFVEKSVNVEVTQLDAKLPDAFYPLVGADLGGKQWEFDGEPFDNTVWWAMVPPFGVKGSDFENDDPEEAWKDGGIAPWWNAAGECCPPFNVNTEPDADAVIGFNLDGNLNYTYTNPAATYDPEGVTWKFSDDFKYLFINDPEAMIGFKNDWGEIRADYQGRYRILELTEDKLVLYSAESILWKNQYDEWQAQKDADENFADPAPVPGFGWIWVLRAVQ